MMKEEKGIKNEAKRMKSSKKELRSRLLSKIVFCLCGFSWMVVCGVMLRAVGCCFIGGRLFVIVEEICCRI